MGGKRRGGGRGWAWLVGAAASLGLLWLLLAVSVLSAGLAAADGACGAGLVAASSTTTTTVASLAAKSAATAIPAAFVPYFAGAAERFALGPTGWAYLAAINYLESDFDDQSLPGVATGANALGAAGPMQIGIGGQAGDTWARYAVAGVPGGASPPGVHDEADAVYAAANLLHADGAPGDWAAAIFAYNHASWYVAQVTHLAASYATSPLLATSACEPAAGPAVAGSASSVIPTGEASIPDAAPVAVQAMLAAGNRIIDQPYSYGGGHSPASMGVPPDPAADPGAQENGAPGYDCSSAVDYILWGAGLGQSLLGGSVPASQSLATVGEPGPGRWVTIYAGRSSGQAHAFIEVDGVVLDTVHLESTTPAGTGPRWQPASEITLELASGSFVARHPPGL